MKQRGLPAVPNTIFSLSDLLELSEVQQFPSVSIFMPTHRAGEETKGDLLRFKNLWKKVEQSLVEKQVRRPDREELLASVSRYTDDSMFWSHQSDGLALFVRPGVVKAFKIPLSVPESAVLSNRFHVKPAMPLFMTNQHYFVLALSLESPRVFEGTVFAIDEFSQEALPAGMQKSIKDLLEQRKELQVRSAGGPGAGQGSVYHGHDPKDMEKDRVEEYCRLLNGSMRELLNGQRAPLLLVGVEYIQSIYRQVNSYENLLPQGINGSPEYMKADEIETSSKEILSQHWQKDQERILSQYRAAAGTGLASDNISEIVPAALSGRVATCMLEAGSASYGRFDRQSGELTLSKQDSLQENEEDLIDLICIETLRNGGSAYVLPREQMPSDKILAASFRY